MRKNAKVSAKKLARTYDRYKKSMRKIGRIARNSGNRCNVPLEGLEEGEYTSDFVCVKSDGDLMVRECLQRDRLTKPMNAKLLNASRNYWLKRGVADWGLVINAEE